MNAEERIQMLKQIPPDSNFEKKGKFRTAIVLTLATVISILFLVFAFIQKLEAEKQREISERLQMEAERQRELAVQQKIAAEYQLRQAEQNATEAAKALEECQNSKR